MKPTDRELQVLRALVVGSEHGEPGWCTPFAPLARRTRLPVAEVRRLCRALRRKGLTEYHSGLWSEEGQPAGAGYCASAAGFNLIEERQHAGQ